MMWIRLNKNLLYKQLLNTTSNIYQMGLDYVKDYKYY